MISKVEVFHYTRAALFGPGAVVVAVVFGLEESVFYLLCMSAYANFAGDISAAMAARADRHQQENKDD